MIQYIGIDPGKSGAIACIDDEGQIVWSRRMPIAGDTFDLNTIAYILKAAAPRMTVVERVSAMPGQGVSGMFSFGMGYGMLQGVLAAIGLPYILVGPQAWHKEVGLSLPAKAPGTAPAARTAEIKGATVAQALRRWPGRADDLKLKADWGRADAMFLAECAKRRSQGTWL